MSKACKYILFPILISSLSACSIFDSFGKKEEKLTPVEEKDLTSEEIETGHTYYKSDKYELHTTIAGYFSYGRPFTLEGTDDKIHVYDNVYLYEGDEFFIAENKSSGAFGLPDFDYCFELKEKSDEKYVDIDVDEYDTTCGSLFIKEGMDGIYKIAFDIETKKIDLTYIDKIDTPKYTYIDHCDIQNIHGGDKKSTAMRVNEKNQDELCVLNYDIPMYASIIFPNNIDCYTRIWLDEGYYNMARTYTKRELIHFSVGGKYNVYLNRKTYTVRLELLNPEDASYNCYYVFYGGNSTATPVKMNHINGSKYIFELKNFDNRTDNGFYRTISFVDYEEGEQGTRRYRLTSTDEELLTIRNDGACDLCVGGIFNFTVNLLQG